MRSRHHHHVATLQYDVLLQVLLFLHISVSKTEDLLFPAVSSHDSDVVLSRIGRQAPGHTQRLQYIRIVAHQIFTGFIHATEDIDPITQYFEHRDRHSWSR